MRLSDEKSRRLSAMVWRERMRRYLPLGIAVVAIFAAATYMLARQLERSDRTLEVVTHAGTVTSIQRAGARSAIAHVHLDDGRDVEALSAMSIFPPAGAHVVVSEFRHASGRLTYDVTRLSD